MITQFLSFEFHNPVEYVHSSTMRYQFEKADYELMREDLKEIDWKSQFESFNVPEMLNLFKKVMLDLGDPYVPIQHDRSNAWKTSFTVPLNKDLRYKIKEKITQTTQLGVEGKLNGRHPTKIFYVS